MKIKHIMIILILLVVSMNIYSNEKDSASIIDQKGFIFSQMSNFSTEGNTNYELKSKRMKGVGIAGIPLMVVGTIMGIAGGAVYGYLSITSAATVSTVNALGGSAPASWSYRPYIGLGIAIAGGLIFVVGLIMTISGFVLHNKFKNKTNDLSINTIFEIKDNNYNIGFSFKFN